MAATQAEKDAYKVMRKGTRACRECRRRKIKCIYDDNTFDICQECTAHSRDCIKQGVVRGSSTSKESTSSVKIQVTRLESAVEKIARENARISGDDAADQVSKLSFEEKELAALEKEYKGRSPIFQLFNNDLFREKGTMEAYATELTGNIRFPDSTLSDKDKLLSTIANVPDVLQVLHFASDWWIAWREQHYALRRTAQNLTLHDFVCLKLAEGSPAAISLGLMAIAMALGQIRPGIDDLTFNLPVPANHIMNYILAGIDQVVCDTEKYQNHSDAILLLIMRAKHHTESNQLRKAWLRIRQAIRCAQRTGFGVASPSRAALSQEEAEQQRFIASIFEIDHLVSMVLGLPYAKDPAFTDARAFSVLLNPTIKDESLNMRALRRIITVTAAQVNDRNASAIIDHPFTESTQATLDMAAAAMPEGWWSLVAQPMSGMASHRYESVMVQLWFWTVQSYLHMPYLIKPSDEEPNKQYRQMCMQGARSLIRSFNYLRTEPAISLYMCNCDDFQALLGACILLVGVLQDASNVADALQKSPVKPHSEICYATVDADLALVEDMKDIFRYRMHEQGGAISKQGLSVLEELTCFIYEDESPPEINADLSGLGMGLNRQQKTIMLPYFGTIKIELTKKLPKRRPTHQYMGKTLLTPPLSNDGSSDHSPPLANGMNFSPPSAYETMDPFNMQSVPVAGNPDPSATFFSSPDATFNISPSATMSQSSFDAAQMPPVAWDQWENYVFDEELNQCWNPNMHWNESLFAN